MISTSIIYFIFLLLTLVCFYFSPVKYRNYVLIFASLVFYAYVRLSYVLLILIIILANYFAGLKIEKLKDRKEKKRYLYLILFLNIGVLIYFKYWNFLIENLLPNEILNSGNGNSLFLTVILPLGLSYYIFQTIGYILDIYRGSIKPESNFSRFSLFVLFFPKLLVGPIERARNLLPQLSKETSFESENIISGTKLILWGLFKKLVVADRISLYVDSVYASLPQHNSSTFLVATLLYPLQVYADFSGYTDIAIGTAKLFGINLMDNFRRPLFAKNVSEFWRRWHISLSSWVNDYIYNPIVLKRRDWGNWGISYALIISFVVIGIWHGASWNFAIFGLIQASALIYESLSRNTRKRWSKKIPSFIYNGFSIIFTFLFFTFSLMVFRTTTYAGAEKLMHAFKAKAGSVYFDQPSTVLFITIGIAIMLLYDLSFEINKNRITAPKKQYAWILQHAPYALLIAYILMAGVFDGGQFIYFAF